MCVVFTKSSLGIVLKVKNSVAPDINVKGVLYYLIDFEESTKLGSKNLLLLSSFIVGTKISKFTSFYRGNKKWTYLG